MKAYGEVEIQLTAFLTLTPNGGGWLGSCNREKAPNIYWIRPWLKIVPWKKQKPDITVFNGNYAQKLIDNVERLLAALQ